MLPSVFLLHICATARLSLHDPASVIARASVYIKPNSLSDSWRCWRLLVDFAEEVTLKYLDEERNFSDKLKASLEKRSHMQSKSDVTGECLMLLLLAGPVRKRYCVEERPCLGCIVLHERTGHRQPLGRDRTATKGEKVARGVEEGMPMNAEELEA